MSLFRRHIGSLEALNLMRNLAVTLRAGVSLPRALGLFEEDAPRGSQKTLIAHLKRQVETGHQLAEAMASAPKEFPPLIVNLVRTGELGGRLSKSLDDIVIHLKKTQELKRKIRNAMLYPTFVLVAVLGLGLSIGMLVLPELIPLFTSLDITLPLSTRMLLATAAFFDAHGLIFTAAVVVMVIMLVCISRLEMMKPVFHTLWLHIPYVKHVQRQVAVAQATGTLSTLLKAGIPIRMAIPATANAVSNRVFSRALLGSVPIVESGHSFAQGLEESGKLIPKMAKTLIDIGEETGTLAEALDYLAEYYEAEVDYAVKNLTTALEPLLLIGIGIIVGGTVLAIITPIYDVTGSIS